MQDEVELKRKARFVTVPLHEAGAGDPLQTPPKKQQKTKREGEIRAVMDASPAPPVVQWMYGTPGAPSGVPFGIALDHLVLHEVPHAFGDFASLQLVRVDDAAPSVACLASVVARWAEMRAQGKGRSARRLLRLLSDLRWPVENAFFRATWGQPPHAYLETHYAATDGLPYLGRLYIAHHAVGFHVSGVWSDTKWLLPMHELCDVRCDGRTLVLSRTTGAPIVLTVLLGPECAAALAQARERYRSSRCFGIPLHVLQARHNAAVPRLVSQCVVELRARGLRVEGLFRVSGSHRVVKKWEQLVDEGWEPPLAGADVHDIATLLKRFLMAIPDGFVSPALWDAVRDLPANMEGLRACVLAHCTPEWMELALFLFSFLADVVAHVEANKMDPNNVAIVFCPVMRHTGDMVEYPTMCALIKTCLVDHAVVFAKPQ